MIHWNVLVNVREHGFSRAYVQLKELGTVYLSDFENVLLMKVSNISEFLEALKAMLSDDSSLSKLLSLVVPVTSTFSFQSPVEFETKAKEAVLRWLPTLAGKSFYVRMHRRGFKGLISSQHEEGFLDQIILQELAKMGNPGHITLEDPDAIIVVETVGKQAGLSCWTREELQRYPLLKLD